VNRIYLWREKIKMFTEVLTGMALLKSGVDFIKSNIDTAKDIGDIVKSLDAVFDGEEQVQRARNKKAKRGIAEQLGLDSVAQEVIDAKIAKEQMEELRIIIDNRFGPGTFQEIIYLRAQRKKEEREQAEIDHNEEVKRRKEFEKNLAVAIKVFIGFSIFVLFCLLLYIFMV